MLFLSEEKVKAAIAEIKEFYLKADKPIGCSYSGGKDSTTVLELFILALMEIPKAKWTKKIHVLLVDTLVEAPPLADYLEKQIERIRLRVNELKLPIKIVKLQPDYRDSFFVNVIGRGYRPPDAHFRWCAERLKHGPMDNYIKQRISEAGEVYVVTGARSDESTNRAQTLKKYTLEGKLKRNGSMPNSIMYTPIEDWKTEEVWDFLREYCKDAVLDNEALEKLYEDGNPNNDVYSKNRMGCWVCTVVKDDKALREFVNHGYELQPLLDFREWLKVSALDKRAGYLIRRNGQTTISLYSLETRIETLRRLLLAQKATGRTLIHREELREIQRLWDEDLSTVTVKEVEAAVNADKPLKKQDAFKWVHAASVKLSSNAGTLEALFEELWEPHTFIEATSSQEGETVIRKGEGYYESINGKEVFVIDKEHEYSYDLIEHSMLKDFFQFAGFTVWPESSDGNSFSSRSILTQTSIFENSFWRISKEPDGGIYCQYGVRMPSRFGGIHSKVLGIEQGASVNEVILAARTKFLSSKKLFKALPSAKFEITFQGKVHKLKLPQKVLDALCQNKSLILPFFMGLKGMNADFLEITFDPRKMGSMGSVMLNSFAFIYGAPYDLHARATSTVLIPAHNLEEIGPLAVIAVGIENVLSIRPIRGRYKYNRALVEGYRRKRKELYELEKAQGLHGDYQYELFDKAV